MAYRIDKNKRFQKLYSIRKLSRSTETVDYKGRVWSQEQLKSEKNNAL